MPYLEISNSDHQLFWDLKSKKKYDSSGNNKSKFENISVSGVEEALILKTKWILNKLCLHPKHSHHGIPTRGHLHYGIPTKRYLHHGLNMCTNTIMDKLCICAFASDICIIWTDICVIKKSICIRNEKSRLAPHFVCIHRKLTSRSMVKSLSTACWGTMVA